MITSNNQQNKNIYKDAFKKTINEIKKETGKRNPVKLENDLLPFCQNEQDWQTSSKTDKEKKSTYY